MSMRADSFIAIAARLRRAAFTFEKAAGLADVASVAAPKALVSSSRDGVNRPVEDIVLAREGRGMYGALEATRRHAVQAVLHAETATRRARHAADMLEES
ncbi:hypothetical protein [Amycolatopsis sp. NPDC059657]|uniref:hypothetical protein n=1 Tax=Amycolatopsis sp. NPDC059657 TaxID=3346899 RepID=UPI00366FA844